MFVLPFQLSLATAYPPPHAAISVCLADPHPASLGSAQASEGESVMFRASCTQWCIEAHQERLRSSISFGLGAQELCSRARRDFPKPLQKAGPVLLGHGRRNLAKSPLDP